jgi:hypothetical protein
MNRRGGVAAATAVIGMLAWSGCAAAEGYSDLSREATAEDAWPTSLPGYAADNVEAGSSRLVGHDGSTALYLAASAEPSGGVCLLIYPEDDNWTVGCGANEVTVTGGGGSYAVRGDGAPDGDGDSISENVYFAAR